VPSKLPQPPRREPGPGVPAARVRPARVRDGNRGRGITPSLQPGQASGRREKQSSQGRQSPAILLVQRRRSGFSGTDREATRALCRPWPQSPPPVVCSAFATLLQLRLSPQAARPAPSRARPSGPNQGAQAFRGSRPLSLALLSCQLLQEVPLLRRSGAMALGRWRRGPAATLGRQLSSTVALVGQRPDLAPLQDSPRSFSSSASNPLRGHLG